MGAGGDDGHRHGGLLPTDLLLAHGVHHLFGLPGGQTLAARDGTLERAPAIQHVPGRDERSRANAGPAPVDLTTQVWWRRRSPRTARRSPATRRTPPTGLEGG
jgi:hypothetical protein